MREMTTSEKISRSMRGKFGNESRRWKGENASYAAKHMWIHKHFGKAKKCSFNPEHKAKRFEWANISGEYKRDISDYIELCPSCHRKYDRKNHCRNGHELSDENIYINSRGDRGCKACRRERDKKWRSFHAIN